VPSSTANNGTGRMQVDWFRDNHGVSCDEAVRLAINASMFQGCGGVVFFEMQL